MSFLNRTSTGGNGARALDEAHVSSWRERGFEFVGDLFPTELLNQLEAAARDRFPEPDSPEAKKFTNFGSALNFPSSVAAFNAGRRSI